MQEIGSKKGLARCPLARLPAKQRRMIGGGKINFHFNIQTTHILLQESNHG